MVFPLGVRMRKTWKFYLALPDGKDGTVTSEEFCKTAVALLHWHKLVLQELMALCGGRRLGNWQLHLLVRHAALVCTICFLYVLFSWFFEIGFLCVTLAFLELCRPDWL